MELEGRGSIVWYPAHVRMEHSGYYTSPQSRKSGKGTAISATHLTKNLPFSIDGFSGRRQDEGLLS